MFHLKCKYKPIIFIPYVAIDENIDFITARSGERECVTADGIKCIANNVKGVNTLSFEAESIIKEIYDVEVLEFLRTWYRVYEYLDSLTFLRIELKKK